MDDERNLRLVLEQWRREAVAGKDAAYKGWTFFDTNCLSELVKLARKGYSSQVRDFVEGRDVLIASTVVQEMRHVPELLAAVPEVLESAYLYLLPDTTKFWQCDIWNFINTERDPRNVLETYLLPADFFYGVAHHLEFIEVSQRSESQVAQEYADKIAPDLGAQLDERELVPVIWSKVQRAFHETTRMDLPIADCRVENFPSFFIFDYTYYFWYMKNSKPGFHTNDFNDIAHAVAAPYCMDFFTERRMASLLRTEIQGRIPPTPFEITKFLHKKGVVNRRDFERARASMDMRRASTPMLPNTRIWSFTDMRTAITGK